MPLASSNTTKPASIEEEVKVPYSIGSSREAARFCRPLRSHHTAMKESTAQAPMTIQKVDVSSSGSEPSPEKAMASRPEPGKQ